MQWVFEIDWDKDGTYTAENARLLEVKTVRGRTRMFNNNGMEAMRPGDLYAVLDNYDGRYDPYNPSGALYGYLLPGRPIRVKAVDGSLTRDVFTGYVYDVRPEGGRMSRAVIRATDGLTYLDRQNCTAITEETDYAVSQAIEDLLNQSEWPLVSSAQTFPLTFPWTFGSTTIDAGADTIDSFTLDAAKTIRAAMAEVAEAFLGTLYVTVAGSLAYRQRNAARATELVLTQDMILTDVETAMPWDEIYNDIRVSPTTGAVQTYSATASQTDYGRNTIDIASNDYIQSEAQALNMANYLGLYLPELKRGLRIRLRNRFSEQFGPDLTARISVTMPALGIDNLYSLGQIEHHWQSTTPGYCTTTYRLEPDYYEIGDLQTFPLTFPWAFTW